MLFWEMTVLCESRKEKGQYMLCNYSPTKEMKWQSICDNWRSRTHHWITADVIFSKSAQPLKSIRWCPQSRAQFGACSASGPQEYLPAKPTQLRNATFSTGNKQTNKQTKAVCVFTALCGAEPLPSAVKVQLTSKLCTFQTRLNVLDQRHCALYTHRRCAALHQLAYAQCCRAFLGESKHAFTGSAYLHSKNRSHYCGFFQRPGNMSIEQHDLAFKQEPSY